MDTREIRCPCCNATLIVKAGTSEILQATPFKKGPAEFNDFLQKQKGRTEELARKFEAVKEKSKTRLRSIEDKIRYAKERHDSQDE